MVKVLLMEIGGRWKKKIDQAMSSTENKRLEFTDKGNIHNIKDVYTTLDYYFRKATKKDSQLAGKNLFTVISFLLPGE